LERLGALREVFRERIGRLLELGERSGIGCESKAESKEQEHG